MLKLDIEGSEFDVVPNLVKSGIEIGQLLIEVHWPLHRAEFSRVPGRKQTTALHTHFFGALESLGAAGGSEAGGPACANLVLSTMRKLSPYSLQHTRLSDAGEETISKSLIRNGATLSSSRVTADRASLIVSSLAIG